MSMNGIRRWLQPAGRLRWHPWAPLTVLLLALGFAFALGAQWGFNMGRMPERDNVMARAFMARFHVQDQVSGNPRSLVNDAHLIDSAVRLLVKESESPPSWLERQNRAIADRILYPWSKRTPEQKRKGEEAFVKDLAEFRLKMLAGSASSWQLTSVYCEGRGASLTGWNVAAGYEVAAQEYSKVLGRRITPDQLAPAVPGGRCPGKEVP